VRLERFGERFLHRIYTDREIALYRSRVPELAARFAAKEAVMKALGTGVRGVGWRDIEVLPQRGGKPLVFLSGRARARAEADARLVQLQAQADAAEAEKQSAAPADASPGAVSGTLHKPAAKPGEKAAAGKPGEKAPAAAAAGDKKAAAPAEKKK